MDSIFRINSIREKAIELHCNQKYGIYPYEIHLQNVVNVLIRYLKLSKNNSYNLIASAWLHDVLEDTEISKLAFINLFGEDIFNIVWCLTDGKKGSYNEKKEVLYKKLITNQDSIIIKLADRIANVEFSIINFDENKLKKYFIQNKRLNEILNDKINTNLGIELLNYLNDLISIQNEYYKK